MLESTGSNLKYLEFWASDVRAQIFNSHGVYITLLLFSFYNLLEIPMGIAA